MPRTRWIRPSVVGLGAILVTGCLLVAFFGPLLFFLSLPEAAPSNGRRALVIPGVPLTVVAVAVAGSKWTRKYHASTTESLGVLIVLQLIPAGFALGLEFGDIGFVMVNLTVCALVAAGACNCGGNGTGAHPLAWLSPLIQSIDRLTLEA